MAEARNIKDLPQSDAIAGGDYFLIETTGGTQLLDFDNFVIDQDNTTFAVDLQTNVTSLSTQVETLTAAVDLTNMDSPIYLVNTSLTESQELLRSNLYGASFESTLQETRANISNDPITDQAREIDNNMETLSAMVFDSLYSQLSSAILNIRGGNDIVNRDGLVYTGGNATDPSTNDGGLLGAVLDTALASVDVYTRQVGAVITHGTPSVSFTLEIPAKYTVTAGSLQYTVMYSGGSDALARTGSTPYTEPGFFAVTGFTRGELKNNGVEYTWTISRYGGKSFDDMVSYTLVTDLAGNPPTIPHDSDGDGTDDTTKPNPSHDPDNGGKQISVDERQSFPFTINARVVVGLSTT